MLKDREGKGLNAVVLDDSSNVIVDGQTYNITIRHVNCDILTDNVKCSPCTVYRSTLRALYSRYIKQKRSIQTSPRSHVNLRYLRTPEKRKRFNSLKARAKAATRKVNLLLEKVKGMSANDGVQLDEQLDQDIVAIMDECREHVESNYSPDSFKRLFWEEQKKARQLKSSKQMRWHPMLIKWCLKMKLTSSAAYSAFRSSGLLMLPSERTLRDYTHWMKAKPGFQIEVDRQLIEKAKLDTIPDYKKYVCIMFDEVKVKEGLVYDKEECNLIGFVDLDSINNHLEAYEQSLSSSKPKLATHIVVFMVRGLFSGFKFAYAQFPCSNLNGHTLYALVW